MNDSGILFFLILMDILIIYRIILAILFLKQKKYVLDEKYYISFFYLSLVGFLIAFTGKIVLGIILVCLLPIVLTLYVTLSKNRVYWLINGYNLSEATIVNYLISCDDKYQNVAYRVNHIKINKYKNEHTTKISFLNLSYDEKEKLLQNIIELIKSQKVKANKNEITKIIIYCFFLLLDLFFILLTLFN